MNPEVIVKQPSSSNNYELSTIREVSSDVTDDDSKSIQNLQRPRIPNCPVGLESLADLEQIIVDQAKELFENMSDIRNNNKFMIMDYRNNNERLFLGVEKTEPYSICIYGAMRDFEMFIMDMDRKLVAKFDSPSALLPFVCCPDNAKYMNVEAPSGYPIGRIVLESYYLKSELNVMNEFGDLIYKVKGPFFTGKCYMDNVFNIFTTNNDVIGQIIAKWGGFNRECESDSDFFEVNFPKDLQVKMKFLLIAACFLLDYVFYSWDSHGLLANHVMKPGV